MDRLGYRLAGKEIVPEIDRPEMGHFRPVFGEPALGGLALAILLLRLVLWRDEFRRQRHDPLVAGRHQAGAEKGMEVFGATVRTAPRAAILAMDLA